MTTTCWMMLSSSSSQCKPVWSKAPQSNPRSSLWKRALIYGYLKGGNFGIAMLNKYHVRNLKAKILMYFFVVWLGGGEVGGKGCFLNGLLSWEFLFYQLLNQHCILQSSGNEGYFFILTCNRDHNQTKAIVFIMVKLTQCELLWKKSSKISQ